MNDGVAFVKPEFQVVNEAKHERSAFGAEVELFVFNDGGSRQGAEDGLQSSLCSFAGVLIVQGGNEVVVIGTTD